MSAEPVAAVTSSPRSSPWLRRSVPLLQLAVVVVVIAVLPGTMPNTFYLFSLTVGAAYLPAVLGLNLAVSGGAVSMGTSAFMLIGAYAVALSQIHWQLHPVLGIAVAVVICAAVGAVTSIPALRLGAFAIAVVTLMYADVVGAISLHFRSFTGGADGVSASAGAVTPSQMWLYVALCGLGVFILHRNLLRGPFGRALMITRRGEAVAASLAVASGRYKVAAFTIYAALSGIAGGLYQQLIGPISIETFNVGISITLLLMVVLGGVASVSGPLLGTIALTVIPMILNQTSGSGGGTRDLVYGIILLLVVLVVPKGLAGVGRGLTSSKLLGRGKGGTDAGGSSPAPIDEHLLAALLSEGRGAEGGHLDVDDVVRTIGGLQILRGVSMTVESGQIAGLIGPNGSGKTTLLNSINGLTPVDRGRVSLGGTSIDGPARTRATAGVGRTFQTAVLTEQASVLENLMVGLDARRKASHLSYALRLPSACREATERHAEAARWAAALGLGGLLGAEASSLTPRERRLLEVGRALATRPRLLLLDEPVAGLTGDEIDEIVAIVRLLRAAGISTILVEHHAELVMGLCDTVTVLDAGEVIASGRPSVVRRDPKVIAAYLGDELLALDDAPIEEVSP
ncbi:MAG: branched-chain amino acid transporter ATP-binding protein/permease [Acidimicrobiales bacterium]|nr:branched-chain amino acid transporter ATP-binding protein/permease [Acidimicrobiales bacterium]